MDDMRRVILTKDLTDKEWDLIMNSELPEEHEHLNILMDDMDFEGVLEWCNTMFSKAHMGCIADGVKLSNEILQREKTIQFALRLAARLQSGELSEEMHQKSNCATVDYNPHPYTDPEEFCKTMNEIQFRAMTRALIEETRKEMGYDTTND
jgi:hypothetical protein